MKKQTYIQKASAIFCLVVALGLSAPAAATVDPVPFVRIGLYWGENALEAANLENAVGGGYQFGYFDEGRQFVNLGYTEETAITMLKDWSMYYANGKYSSEPPDGGDYRTVGCYHIRLPERWDTFVEARDAAAAYEDAFPAYYGDGWAVCVGSYASQASAEASRHAANLNGTAMTASSACVTVVATGTSRILFQMDCGEERSLGVMPRAGEGERALTWFRGNKYYGGFQYKRFEGGDLTVVNFVGMDDYIKGLVPYEMNPEWPIEALKAQAVTARTYAAAHLNSHRSAGFDLCNGVCCQTYLGANASTAESDRAVDETSRVYMTYQGEYANTFYHSCDGGATENSENVFYEEIPYLRGKIDPYESHVETGFENWSYVYTAEEITEILRMKNYHCGRILSVTPTYTALGNIYSLKFTDENGKSWTFAKDKAASILHSSTYGKYTHSQRYTVSAADGRETELCVNGPQGNVEDPEALYVIDGAGQAVSLAGKGSVTVLSGASTRETVYLGGSGATITADSYRFSGSGWGHNVGMSQFGAKAMAELGFSYQEILDFYFHGVDIG